MKPATISFHKRNLPHWSVAESSYFVTFCLKDSIPKSALYEMKKDFDEFQRAAPSQDALEAYYRSRFKKVEHLMDTTSDSPRHLAIPAIANLILSSFDWLESTHGWETCALVIMPNHVHALMRNIKGLSDHLGKHVGILKGWTAREANRILNRSGDFWLSEIFDRWCRNEEKRQAAIRYIQNNPVRAGLVKTPNEWPWTKIKETL